MDGILPVYKPVDITSFDVIRQIKKQLPHGQKVGHAGTLDPFADGVLILMLGKATKRFDEIGSWHKTYRAVARLGYKSDTLDRTGAISKQEIVSSNKVEKIEIQKIADGFVGEIDQAVPAYSAAKYKGKPLYKYARRGESVPQKSKKIMIYSIKVSEVICTSDLHHWYTVMFEVECGSGTYIRQLSYDIFCKLGSESYLEELTRTNIGEIGIDNCRLVDSKEPFKVWEG